MQKISISFVFIALMTLLLAGCGDSEEKARALYNEALVEQRAGNT